MEKSHLRLAMRPSVEQRSTARNKWSRISKACFRCQQKKVRCDGKTPRCSTCTLKQLDCQYQQVQNKRGKGKSKQHIKELQDRLSKMESLLLGLGHSSKDEQSQTEPTSLQSQSQPSSSTNSFHITALLDQDKNTPSVAVNSSVVDALLNENASMSSECFETLGHYWHQVSQRLHQYSMGEPVSPREPEVVLVIMTIKDICAELPLFYMPWFLERLRHQHTAETCDRPSWWACLNAVLALSISRRIANGSFREMSVFVWAFFKNAYAVFPDIVRQADDLLASQALLTMAVLMKTSADYRTTALLLSNACRIIHTLGLHIRIPGKSHSVVEKETRNRIFWIAFVLETEISICGIPSPLDRDSTDIDLPTECSPDSCGLFGLEEEHRSASIFRLRAELAKIQSRVQKKLYSMKSLKRTGSQLVGSIQELQVELHDWISRVHSEIRPEFDHSLTCSMQEMPIVNLHLMYFNCVSMIHWTAMRGSSWKEATDNAYSVSQYRAAARSIITLLNCIFDLQFSCLWQALPFAVSACLVLLVDVLEYPHSLHVQVDIKLLKSVLRLIVRLKDEEGYDLVNLHTALSAMVRIAESAINGYANVLQSAVDQSPDAAARAELTKLESLIRSCTHPIYLAQSLMSNLPNRDTDSSRTLSGILGVIWEEDTGYGPFVPDVLKPHTYGFGISDEILLHRAARSG